LAQSAFPFVSRPHYVPRFNPPSVNPFDAESAEFKKALLYDARADFPAFYVAASEADAFLHDSLVLGYAAIVALTNAPREDLPDPMRQPVERAIDAFDQLFAACREAVRACPTFAALDAGERARIERKLFRVPPVADV
jgi:hypothetical protein